MSMQLMINDGKYGIRNYCLEDFQKDIIGFGRQPDSDIVMNSSFVSRLHGCIYRENGYWYIKDLDSSYGLSYNRNRVSDMRINGGEHITIISPSGEYAELVFNLNLENVYVPHRYVPNENIPQVLYGNPYSLNKSTSANKVVFIVVSIILWILLAGTYFLPWSEISMDFDFYFLDDILKTQMIPFDVIVGREHYKDLIWLFLFILPFVALHIACFREHKFILLGLILSIVNLGITIVCVVVFSTPFGYLLSAGDFEYEFEREIYLRTIKSLLSPRIGCFIAVLISIALLVITIVYMVLMFKEDRQGMKKGMLDSLIVIGIYLLSLIVSFAISFLLIRILSALLNLGVVFSYVTAGIMGAAVPIGVFIIRNVKKK